MTYQFMRCASKTCSYESPYFDTQKEKAFQRFLVQKGLLIPVDITCCPLCQQDSLVPSQAEQMCLTWDEEGQFIASETL